MQTTCMTGRTKGKENLKKTGGEVQEERGKLS